MHVFPTFRCEGCNAEFKFIPITPVENDVTRHHPEFCPYCGRESNFGAEDRTSFKKVGLLDWDY